MIAVSEKTNPEVTGLQHVNILPVRFTDQEVDDILLAADERGVDVFELMRNAVLDDIHR